MPDKDRRNTERDRDGQRSKEDRGWGAVLEGSGIQHLTVNVAVVIVTETH